MSYFLNIILQVYVYFNGYDVKGSPFMMRVGTQKRHKSSSSPNTTYRQSPTGTRLSSSSPINVQHLTALNTSRNANYTHYRENSSPILSDSHKYAQEYHKKSVMERQMTSNSPRAQSPSYLQRSVYPIWCVVKETISN